MTSRQVRMLALGLPVVTAALTLLSWSQTWVALTLNDGKSLVAAGATVAPALPPLALASLALVAALALAGLVFRMILGVLLALIGSAVVASSALVYSDPIAAAAAGVTATTGVDGLESVRLLVAEASVTVWPAIAVAVGVGVIVVGVWIAITARRWPERTRRYDRVRFELADDLSANHQDDWDALSDGDDPTAR